LLIFYLFIFLFLINWQIICTIISGFWKTL